MIRPWYFLTLAAVPLILRVALTVPGPDLTWWTAHGLEKIHPNDAEPDHAAHAVKISAASNEFEPFQVVFRAERIDIDQLDVTTTDLRSADGIIPSKYLSIYLERYIDLTIPSSVEGGTGEWPDALVPRVDEYAHEKRNAFPFKLDRGRNQTVWIDVYVPRHTPAGIYHGQVLVTRSGKPELSIPIDLEVWNFELPSTSSLITTFGFSGGKALRGHYGKYTNDDDLYALTSTYQKAALWHRITLDVSAGIAVPVDLSSDRVLVHWEKFDGILGPFLNGEVFRPDEPLYGAKATSVALHTPDALKSPEQQIQFWREVAEHFRRKGWFERLFNYLWDEPQPVSYPALVALGQNVHIADPQIKNLVTAPLHPEWSDVIDIWTPVINCFERKPHYPDYCKIMVSRSGYDSELGKGKELWWYQACSSHGCNVIGGNYFTGWPSYMIDSPSIRSRIMEWLSWKYRIRGELYFSTDQAFGSKQDPWKDLHLFGGNGDGTLFYPGRPDVIGGKTHIPIESIRLKLIREGMEDYEYLTMLSTRQGFKPVDDAVSRVVRNTHDFEEDPKAIYALRQWMGSTLGKAAQ
jgi:hypothetical protein